jgi:hypothetical protein
MRGDELPEEIYLDKKAVTNELRYLDYKNESNVKYIREDIANRIIVKHIEQRKQYLKDFVNYIGRLGVDYTSDEEIEEYTHI